MALAAACVALIVAGLLFAGCRPEMPATPPPALELAPRPAPGPSAFELMPADLVVQPLERLPRPWALAIVSGDGIDERALGEGFSVPESSEGKPFVWATGERSRVRFALEEPVRCALELRARPFAHAGAGPQHLDIELNGAPVGRFPLPERGSDYEIPLPLAPLRAGWNEIVLVPAWSARPADVIPGDTDTRSLSVAVDRLRILRVGPPIEPVIARIAGAPPRDALAQGGDGVARWLLRPAPGTRLDLSWVAPRAGEERVRVRIEAETDDGVRTLWSDVVEPDGRSGARSIDLAAFGGRAVRLRAGVAGLAPGERWVWTSLALRGSELVDAAEAAPPSRAGLNVVVVVLDAAQRARFGAYGNERATTPHVDAIAREGIAFDDAVAAAPYTLASTASLFTGRPPPRHGVVEKKHRLGPEATTLASTLRDAGYATAAFSANIFVTRRYGMDRGFDTFEELFKRPGLFPIVPAAAFDAPVQEWLRGAAAGARSGERPFFLYLHYIQPHEPYDVGPPEAYTGLDPAYRGPIDGRVQTMYRVYDGSLQLDDADREQLARLYEGNLRYADAAVGRLVEELRALDLLERTLLVVTSDHGEALGEHDLYGHNTSVDQAMIAIPLIVRLPEDLAALRGVRSGAPVATVDVASLVLETLALPVPPEFEGRNPLRSLAGDGAAGRLRYARTAGARPDVGIWLDDAKCVLPGDDRPERVGAADAVDGGAGGDAASLPVTIDLCRAARVAFEQELPVARAAASGNLSAQERDVLEALGYLRE